MSTSLKPILTDPIGTDLGTENIARFLSNYWEAWRRVAPEAFDEPESFVIQKTAGVFSLHMVARYVLKLFDRRRNTSPSVDDLIVVIEDMGDAAQADYWRSGNADGAAMAGSMSGFKIIADTIIEELQDRGHSL